jgi:hypothetical protein
VQPLADLLLLVVSALTRGVIGLECRLPGIELGKLFEDCQVVGSPAGSRLPEGNGSRQLLR